MSFYSIPTAIFLNNILNQTVKINKLKFITENIFTSLLTSENRIGVLSNEFEELVETYDTTPLPFYNKLQKTITIDGKRQAVGFNQISISSVVRGDPSILLTDLEDDLLNYYEKLKLVNKYTNVRLQDYNGILTLHNNNIQSKYMESLSNYTLGDSFLKYIYNQSEYGNTNYDNWNGIVLLTLCLQLLQIYNSGWNLRLKLLKNVKRDSSTSLDNFKLAFTTYLNENLDEIADDFTNFFIRNVLLYSNVTSAFETTIKNQIKEDFIQLPILFNDFIDDNYETGRFIENISNIISNEILNTTILNILFTNIYPNYDNFYTTTLDFNSEEDVSGKQNGLLISSNSSKLQRLEYLIYQYKLQPLFFINSHLLLYDKFTKDLLTGIEVGDISPSRAHLETWLKNITLHNATDLITLISNYGLDYTTDTQTFALKTNIKDIITDFILSTNIKNFIINTILPNIITKINTKYYYNNPNIYREIDSIQLFLQSQFINYLFNDSLFNDYMNNYSSIISLSISESSFSSSSQTLTNVMNNFYNNSEKLILIYKNLFMSSSITSFLSDLLSNFEIQ
jgi:hypothetical protein